LKKNNFPELIKNKKIEMNLIILYINKKLIFISLSHALFFFPFAKCMTQTLPTPYNLKNKYVNLIFYYLQSNPTALYSYPKCFEMFGSSVHNWKIVFKQI